MLKIQEYKIIESGDHGIRKRILKDSCKEMKETNINGKEIKVGTLVWGSWRKESKTN